MKRRSPISRAARCKRGTQRLCTKVQRLTFRRSWSQLQLASRVAVRAVEVGHTVHTGLSGFSAASTRAAGAGVLTLRRAGAGDLATPRSRG